MTTSSSSGGLAPSTDFMTVPRHKPEIRRFQIAGGEWVSNGTDVMKYELWKADHGLLPEQLLSLKWHRHWGRL